jgi:hypothetical protein
MISTHLHSLPGIVQIACFRSISDQTAPRASPIEKTSFRTSRGPAAESKISRSCKQRRRGNHVRDVLDRRNFCAHEVLAAPICAECFSKLSRSRSEPGGQFDLATRFRSHPAEDLWRSVVLDSRPSWIQMPGSFERAPCNCVGNFLR